MRPSRRSKWSTKDDPSPSEIREMRERGEWMDPEEDEAPRKKAPFVFRLLAWVSLIAIFFAVGYGLTSFFFSWIDRGGTKTPSNVVATVQQTDDLMSRTRSEDQGNAIESYVTVTLSIPEGTNFVTRQIQCAAGLREDVMKQALSAYLDAVKESKLLDPVAQNLNMFQSGDWLYINMNKSFLDSLKNLGADKSRYVLTGLVKTMSDNFAPVSKVKFYVDGKEVTDKKPVDLTQPWGISSRSR